MVTNKGALNVSSPDVVYVHVNTLPTALSTPLVPQGAAAEAGSAKLRQPATTISTAPVMSPMRLARLRLALTIRVAEGLWLRARSQRRRTVVMRIGMGSSFRLGTQSASLLNDAAAVRRLA